MNLLSDRFDHAHSQVLGCDTDFRSACTHAFSEFSHFPAKIQWIFRFVGIFDRLIHFVHP